MAPVFDYKAYGQDGKVQKGITESDSIKNARLKLKKQGLSVFEISEKSTAGLNSKKQSIGLFSGKASLSDVSTMTRQLASLIKANIPLVDALGALVEQIEVPQLKLTLAQVRQDVNEGLSLTKAMGKHPKVFDSIYLNMIEAGESSGTLGLVMLKLADLKESQLKLKNKVVGALTYPALMLVVGIGLMIAIFVFMIPKIAAIFESMNKPLPESTKFMIAISNSLINYWYVYLILVIVTIIAFERYIATESGRSRFDAFKLKAPIFGPLFRMLGVARFASTMSTLLGSGVPIITAMGIAKNLVGNVHIAKAVQSARENITEGQSIAEPLKRSGQFPPLVIHMISIGEKTGELPSMLKSVSDGYDEQITSKIASMTSLIEPIMMIGMGGMVGIVVVSVFLPLMEMMNFNQ
jgi:general secretion pathway protein F